MKNKLFSTDFKAMLPFLLCIASAFYLLPLLMINEGLAMMLLLAVIPLVCLMCSVVYGMKHSFNVLYVCFVMILFLPTVFIYYNATAWVYAAVYGGVALVGNAVGMAVGWRRK